MSSPFFKVLEIDSPAEFKKLLMLFTSAYEGYDADWYYLSASLTSKMPVGPDDIEGGPYGMIYKIRKQRVRKEWLQQAAREKQARLKEQLKIAVPFQFIIPDEFAAWLRRTKPAIGDEWPLEE
jgi:hypothetical protein